MLYLAVIMEEVSTLPKEKGGDKAYKRFNQDKAFTMISSCQVNQISEQGNQWQRSQQLEGGDVLHESRWG